MATLLELRNLFGNADLKNKTASAVVIEANAIAQNSTAETSERLFWAQRALGSADREADKALKIILAQNSTANVSAILAASDVTIQNNVATAVPVLVLGSTSGV
jgi:hypothetical protein